MDRPLHDRMRLVVYHTVRAMWHLVANLTRHDLFCVLFLSGSHESLVLEVTTAENDLLLPLSSHHTDNFLQTRSNNIKTFRHVTLTSSSSPLSQLHRVALLSLPLMSILTQHDYPSPA